MSRQREPGRQGDDRRVLRFPTGATDESADDAVARLLELAGPRRPAPEDVHREVRQIAYAAWQQKVQDHARATRRQVWRLAAAAVVTAGLGLGLWWALASGTVPMPAGPVVATVETLSGEVALRDAEQDVEAVDLGPGAELRAGTVVETRSAGEGDAREGRMALRLSDGTSVRVDAGSRLVLAAARELSLDRGAVYVDTGRAGRDGSRADPLAVHTSYGVARDIGTQFEVRLGDDALRVRVRRGRVEVDTGADTHAAAAGVALRVDARGRAEREAIAPHGTSWSWVLETSPPFELEGRTLAEYLSWLTRETGWRVEYADAALQQEADEITVHGSLTGLRPDETPEMVLPGAALGYRLEGGTLTVRR